MFSLDFLGILFIASLIFNILILFIHNSTKAELLKLKEYVTSNSKESFLIQRIDNMESNFRKEHINSNAAMQNSLNSLSSGINKNQLHGLEAIQNTLRTSLNSIESKVVTSVDKLNKTTEERLLVIGKQVDERLNKGLEKSNATFTDIIKRLAIIDNAQQKITDLSNNVVSLQEILADKRSRGAFGEIQLNTLVSNMLPKNSYNFQYVFKTGMRADCVLNLPEPTGTIAIDAKFPLESFSKMMDVELDSEVRDKAKQQFKQDLKKHIQDIKAKYIIPNETSDGAIMFLPSEAIFAEIHAHFPEIVTLSHQSKVWISSPTTMMAILTTVRAVIKDDATKRQVHIIQEHLRSLSQDFSRFDKRMDNLSRHIQQASADVEQVNTTAKKISQRFQKIDSVEINNEEKQDIIQ